MIKVRVVAKSDVSGSGETFWEMVSITFTEWEINLIY